LANDHSRHRSHRRFTRAMGDWQTYAVTSGMRKFSRITPELACCDPCPARSYRSFCTPARRVFGTEIDSSWLCPVTGERSHGRPDKTRQWALERERRYQAIREVQAAVGRELAARSEIPKTIPSRIADLLRELHRRLRPAR
jgi:hypothetical protein